MILLDLIQGPDTTICHWSGAKFKSIVDYSARLTSPKSSSTPKVARIARFLTSAGINVMDKSIADKIRIEATKTRRHKILLRDLDLAMKLYPNNQHAAVALALKLNCDRASTSLPGRRHYHRLGVLRNHGDRAVMACDAKLSYIFSIRESTLRSYLYRVFEVAYGRGSQAGWINLNDVKYYNQLEKNRKTSTNDYRVEYRRLLYKDAYGYPC